MLRKVDSIKNMNINRKHRFIDLFCGLGAFRLGFERHNFECVFSSDFNEKVQKVYQDNFNEKPWGDITKISPNEIPNFEILLGGFPCQPFSISGKKLGFNDTRGTLFFNICDIIKVKKPKVVILENVKNLINHDKKRTLSLIIDSLEELGYCVNWQLLNACDFGLPQNRERIFIVASKNKFFDFDLLPKNKSKPLKYFLDKSGDFEWLKPEEYTLLDKRFVKQQPDSGLIFVGYRNKNRFTKGIRPNTEHLNRSHRQPNRIYSAEGYHPTLPSQESNRRFFIFIPEKRRVRKLTLAECYRIMGFPENYKLSFSDGIHTVQIGNSCAVTVIEEIAKQITKQGLLDYEYRPSLTVGRYLSKGFKIQSELAFA